MGIPILTRPRARRRPRRTELRLTTTSTRTRGSIPSDQDAWGLAYNEHDDKSGVGEALIRFGLLSQLVIPVGFDQALQLYDRRSEAPASLAVG